VSRPKVLNDGADPAPPDARPSLAKPARGRSLLHYLLPVSVILISVLSLALPIFLAQYALGLVIACIAALGSMVGMVLLVLTKGKAAELNAAGAAISLAAVLLGTNILLLKDSIARNDELRTKNEQLATAAKADNDEAKKKLAEAEEAPRKAAEILKKADEAPKKAEVFFTMAKEAQEKTEAAEKRTADLLAKVEELEKKNDLDRKKVAEDRANVTLSEQKLKALQKSLDQTSKEIAERRQELVTLKKEIEADKKTAADELAGLKKEVEADGKKAEEKHKETKDLLKKIEETVKGAAANLKDKNPAIRIKTANALAKLPSIPESKVAAEPLVEAMMDPMPEVRSAASEALAKIAPSIQPHVLTLLIGNDKRGAARQLQGLGKEAKFALPVLIHCYRSNAEDGGLTGDQLPQIRAIWLDSLAGVAPDDKRVVRIVLDEVTNKKDRFHFAREKAISLLDTVQANKTDKIKASMTVLDDRVLAVKAVIAIERIGPPEAAEAIPALKKLKLSTDDALRQAATSALTKIEATK
jgi:HEAT repeat